MGGQGLHSFAISVGGYAGLHRLIPSGVVFITRDKVGAQSSVGILRGTKMGTILVNRALVEGPSGGTTLSRLSNEGWGVSLWTIYGTRR